MYGHYPLRFFADHPIEDPGHWGGLRIPGRVATPPWWECACLMGIALVAILSFSFILYPALTTRHVRSGRDRRRVVSPSDLAPKYILADPRSRSQPSERFWTQRCLRFTTSERHETNAVRSIAPPSSSSLIVDPQVEEAAELRWTTRLCPDQVHLILPIGGPYCYM